MNQKIDHIGIAVPDLAKAMEDYRALGFELGHTEEVPEQKVRAVFCEIGDAHLELLEATAEDSPIAKFLAKRGSGIHHLCIQVDDIDQALRDYRAAGVKLINEEPVIGAGGHRVAFVHPRSAAGVLLELMEA